MKKNCLEIVRSKCESCKACALAKTRTNVVFSDGNPSTAKIVLIGEAPGETEDLTGVPFVGRAGQLLNEFLENAGISREDDLYMINTVKCRPPENRVPTDEEKAACRKFLNAQIDIINPKAIILCGATALKEFYPTDKKTTISKLRGQWLDINVDGKDYKFVSFDAFVNDPTMLVSSRIGYNLYGINRSSLEAHQGRSFVTLDTDGILQLEKSVSPQSIRIMMISAPSRVVIQRMINRGERLDDIRAKRRFDEMMFGDSIMKKIKSPVFHLDGSLDVPKLAKQMYYELNRYNSGKTAALVARQSVERV